MPLKSIEVRQECPKHGKLQEPPVIVAGVSLCPKCVLAVLRYGALIKAHEVRTVRREWHDDTATIVCSDCGGQRLDDDRPCGLCGRPRVRAE